MDRLTAIATNGMAYLAKVKPNEQDVESDYPDTLRAILESIQRLADYENKGLTPEEIVSLQQDCDYWHREAIKWAGKLGEHRIKFRKLLNDFGIPESDFPDNELEQFLFSTRQQDMKGGGRDE